MYPSELPEFIKYAESKGFRQIGINGNHGYEVLRMSREVPREPEPPKHDWDDPECTVLIVYTRKHVESRGYGGNRVACNLFLDFAMKDLPVYRGTHRA